MPAVRLELAHHPESASRARAAVGALVAETWPGSSEALDDALIVTGELVGNAVRHGSPPVLLQAEAAGPGAPRALRISCSDGGPWREPVAGEGGRGLPIVRALAASLTIERRPGDTTVTAVLEV